MKNRKTWLAIVMVVCMSIVLAGCFNAANQPAELPNDTTTPVETMIPGSVITPAPEMSGATTTSPDGTTAAPMQPFDWMGQASAVEGRINMFSEISESTVVAEGQTALVGVKFTPTYKGELTQRIRDMIAGEVMAADTNITVVAVTDDPANYQKIQQLAQRMAAGSPSAELKTEIDTIAKDIGTIS